MSEANLVSTNTVRLNSLNGTCGSVGSRVGLQNNVPPAPGGFNTTWVVKSLILANRNTDGTDTQVFVRCVQQSIGGSPSSYLLYNTWIPYHTNLTVIHDQIPIYLQYTDEIHVEIVQGNTLDVYFGYNNLSEW